jgi:hypothetical protein
VAINAVVMSAVSFGVGALVNALTGPPKRENLPTYGNTEESPTYSWDGIQNTTRNGTPIQLVFGVHKVAGQFLSTFTKALSDGSNKLYALVGLCAGEISAINGKTTDQSDLTSTFGTGLEFSGNAAENYNGIEVSYRLGSFDQEMISGFDDVVVQVDQNLSIDYGTDTQTYTTTGEVQAAELNFRFPGGLYQVSAGGAFRPYEIEIRFRYKESGGAYGSWETVTFSNQTRAEYNKQHRLDFTDPATYVIEIQRLTETDNAYQQSACSLISVNEITYDDIAYNGIALCGVKALASDQLNGRLPDITNIVHGKKVKVYRPTDHFGLDTQQDFHVNGDTALLWGWNAENTAYAQSADSHNYADETLEVQIRGQSTSDWNDATTTGPFVYKEITGDFDIRIDISITTGKTNGEAIGIV